MKKFMSGLLIGVILTTCGITFATPALTAVKNTFTTIVYGKVVKQNIVTINGTYYTDIKQLASNLGIKYAVDIKTKKILLGETPITNKYTMKNPAPIGTTQSLNYKNYTNEYKADITVKEIIRGDKAWELIKLANMFNEEATNGYEYILAKIDFKLKYIPNGKSFDLNGTSFNLISQTGKEYDYVSVVDPEPTLDANLYEGAYSEGWATFLVKSDDTKPLLAYGRKYDGTGGIWFKAY